MFEFFFEQAGHVKDHVAFDDRLVVADLHPTFFHAGPLSAEVAGIESDAESTQATGGVPIARDGFDARLIGREVETEGRLAGCGHDGDVVVGDGEIFLPRIARRVDLSEQADKFVFRDGLLEAVEGGPIGWCGQRGKFLRAGEVRE